MPEFRYLPQLPAPSEDAGIGFHQEIRLCEGRDVVARAVWHAPAGRHGVVQIVELSVSDSKRRQGHGGTVLRELVNQAQRYHRERESSFRRIWVCVEQKTQVNARAFLTQHGFHHVATTKELLRDEDALTYVKAYD